MTSILPVRSGSVHLTYSTEISNTTWLKHSLLGPYRTLMAIGTLANKYFYPEIAITEQAPRIQGYIDTAAHYMGFNPTYPYIKELHLLRSPIRYEEFRVPCTHHKINLPLLQFPVNTFHMHNDPVLNAAILKPHRKDQFSGGSDAYQVALNLLRVIFPNTTFTENDFLLTCEPEFSKALHKSIIKALDGKKIDQIIHLEAEKLIERWKLNPSFDLPTEMRRFSAAILTQVFFDTREGHEDLEKAVSFMNDYLLKKSLGMLAIGDEEKFQTACATFRNLTNAILSKSDSPFPGNLTEAQKQGQCLLIFFAGMETTSFALNHNFASLALDPEEQDRLRVAIEKTDSRDEEVDAFVKSKLAEIPPVDGLSRKMTEDGIYTFKAMDFTTYTKHIRKGEKILTKLNSKSIFGKGANGCIGQALAMKELKQSIQLILPHFKLSTTEEKFHYDCKISNQAKPFQITAQFIEKKETGS